ncbi:MAG: hypothetical protein EPN34_00425 [Burkholderiaceae bacterium]|nr:MAG: hypothetical protein EPN34_00425 [Burkholderiaceae bacterium]
MKLLPGLALAIIVLAFAGLMVWRQFDDLADRRVGAKLAAFQVSEPARFDPALVAQLPEPARRYFEFVIKPGTPLHTVAEIEMTGRFSLGTQDSPNYLPMAARQTLAGPAGFVWRMSAQRGLLRISGSDALSHGGNWTRFWLIGLLPVARVSGTADHRRSAFGRAVAEAAFWTPAALLPGPGITWTQVDATTARVAVRYDGMEQSVDVTIAADGRPVRIALQRWSDANADKVFRLQLFGGLLSEFRDFDGFRLPTRVEAGNQFGTAAYFPFYLADVTRIAFPSGAGR